MNRWIRWLTAIAALAAGCSDSPPALPLVGTLERDRLELVAEANERIVEIAVKEGEAVAAGDVVFRLDATLRETELRAVEAERMALAQRLAELVRGPRQERIREARARLAGARENLVIQSNELDRIGTLVNRNLASESDLDRARNAREAAEADVEALTAALDELLEGTTTEELAQAEARLAEADARVDRARIAVERLSVEAPRAGQIDVLPYEVGERPPAGATVAVMLADQRPYARVYVPEPLRARVVPGLAATIRVDGIDRAFAGSVRYVASDPVFTPYFSLTQRDRSRLAYLAEVTLDDASASDLPVGIPVEADFPSLR